MEDAVAALVMPPLDIAVAVKAVLEAVADEDAGALLLKLFELLGLLEVLEVLLEPVYV